MADSTLAAIRTKVRRLTRSPSTQQLATADIDEYIDTFISYDFPQELRLFSFRKTLRFYTEPNVDLYETSATIGHPLYNFRNIYSGIFSPIYISGYKTYLSHSQEEFYNLYPFQNTIIDEATGDGVTVAYAGTLASVPVLRNRVLFTSIDATGATLEVYDDGAGVLAGDGAGAINYTTGVYTFTFTAAPANGEIIRSHTAPYEAARPDTVLFFNNQFILRPVPDQIYPVDVEVDMRPSEVLLAGDSPDLEQWWQYIAYGASKKVFEDRSDMASIQEIMPEYLRQERLVLRRTIINLSQDRTSTIYTDSIYPGYGSNYRR